MQYGSVLVDRRDKQNDALVTGCILGLPELHELAKSLVLLLGLFSRLHMS